MNRRRFGFTLVELIIVISVIGILAAVTVVGFSRYQADTRDARRESSAATISEALEKYYDENGEYPSCAALEQDASIVTTEVLPGIQAAALVAPQSSSSLTNAIQCGETLTINGADFFEYEGDGSSTCLTGDSCLSYALKYKDEASGTIQSLDSRRQTSFATSNLPTVTVGTIAASTVDLSWTAVNNAASYKIQRATNSGFTTNFAELTTSSTSITVPSLSPTTLYYFRVAGVSGSTTGTWSTTVTATTLSVDPPNLDCSAVNSSTQMTISWLAMPGATSYTLQRSTSASFTSPTNYPGITGTSQAVTGLTLGTLYYYRAQTVSGSATSTWSSTCSGGPVLAPTGIGSSAATCGQISVTWAASTGATSYNIQHSTSAGFTSPTTSTGHTGTSGILTGLTSGTLRYFRVYAVLGSAVSSASSSTSATPVPCAPAAYNITSSNNGTTLTATSDAICGPGSTADYQWYANGSAWQSGTGYQTVTYTPGYNTTITLTVNTRCSTSAWVGASNNASFYRPVPAPNLADLVQWSGNRLTTAWNNICGGTYQLWIRQGSWNDYPDPRRWLDSGNANAGSTPDAYAEQDNRVWSSASRVYYNVRATCNGATSGWSNTEQHW
jgi:prepilin-type N-terminal cleavage/methylation domain-containing protein